MLSVCYLWRAFLQFALSHESDDLTVQPPATETLVSKYLAPAIVDEWLDCGEELFQHLPMPMYVHTQTHTQYYLGKGYAILYNPFPSACTVSRYGIIHSHIIPCLVRMWYPSLPCSLVQQISYICIHVECNVSITPYPFTLPYSAATMT